MKYLNTTLTWFLASSLLGVASLHAQNRNAIGFPQQNQQAGIGATAQTPFGTTGQSPFGQQGGRTQSGIGGQPGGFGGQLGQRLGQPPVGGQDGFVGSDAQQIRDQRNNNPRARRRAMFDFAIDSLNEMRESRRRERSNRSRKPPVRVQLRPLFTVQQPSATDLTTQVRSQINRALPSSVGATQISVSGSTAIIQGTAKSDYDRQLAAKMLSLQPGISRVDNQITVETGLEDPLLAPAR